MTRCRSVFARATVGHRRAILAAIARREWLLQMLALAAAGCGRGERARRPASRVTILYPVDDRALGPYWQMPCQFLLFLPLVTQNERGEPEGRLAHHWEHSSDYRTWTFTLRRDVRWHDGTPVTAEDIKFTLDLFSHPKVLVNPPGTYSVDVHDNYTYSIAYRRQPHTSPVSFYTVYYPKHLLADLDPATFYDWPFWTEPVGNGPYRYGRRVSQTMVELEANPDYFRGKPTIERVVLKFGRNFGEAPPLTELLSGGVDAVPYVNRTDLPKVLGDRRFNIYFHLQPDNLQTILWNRRHPVLSDARVRHGLTLAIDRRTLNRFLYLPDDIPIVDALFTDRQFQRGELPQPLPYDPPEARRLLDEAGWPLDARGERSRGGPALRFTALAPELQDMHKAAVYVQAQFRAVGVRMDIEPIELEAMRARVRAGRFDAAFFPIYTEGEFGHRSLFGAGSPFGEPHPKIAALLDAAEDMLNPDEIDRVYEQLAPVFRADLPATLLYPSVWTHVVHRRVRGLSSPWHADPAWYLEDLWIEE